MQIILILVQRDQKKQRKGALVCPFAQKAGKVGSKSKAKVGGWLTLQICQYEHFLSTVLTAPQPGAVGKAVLYYHRTSSIITSASAPHLRRNLNMARNMLAQWIKMVLLFFFNEVRLSATTYAAVVAVDTMWETLSVHFKQSRLEANNRLSQTVTMLYGRF